MLGILRTRTAAKLPLGEDISSSKEPIDGALASALEALASGHLDKALLVEHRAAGAIRILVDALRREARTTLGSLVDIAADTAETGTNVGWITNDVREVADSSAAIASSVEKLAGSIAELSASSATSADGTAKVRDETDACVIEMRGAGESMRLISTQVAGMRERLAVLESAVKHISEMAITIEKISSQTNLLALNATIEAVRAGESGRGFAVVASEVKSLSGQTARATDEIRARLSTLTDEMSGIKHAMQESSASVASGENAVRAAEQRIAGVGNQMAGIADVMTGISNVLGQQRTATNEISIRVGRIANKTKKTRGEIDGSLARLLKAENGALNAIRTFEAKQDPRYELMRAKADLITWKRRLAAVLVGLGKPDPTLVEAQSRRILHWCDTVEDAGLRDHGAFLALRSAEGRTHLEACRCLEAVRASSWSVATDAYMATEKAIDEVLARTDDLVGVIDGDAIGK